LDSLTTRVAECEINADGLTDQLRDANDQLVSA